MRNNLMSSQTFSSPTKYYEFIEDNRYDVHGVYTMSEKMVRVYYTMKDDYILENPTSNIIVALWTTSAARVHLFKSMKNVVEQPGCRLYYTDTDSLVISHPRGKCPVQIGNMLGELTDELEGKEILEFHCGGNKQYSLR